MRVRRAMQVAQALYEGVDLGGSQGTVGLITYMRTDSTRISDQARDAAREFIVSQYGEAFHGGRVHRVKEGAQDAHEAIRPTLGAPYAATLADVLKRDELRLYTLIWERFVASQMSAAVLRSDDGRRRSRRVRFPRDRHRHALPRLHARLRRGQGRGGSRQRPRAPAGTAAMARHLDCRKLEPKQHFTEPPPRYTEAALVKALEETASGGRRRTRRSSRRFRRAAT